MSEFNELITTLTDKKKKLLTFEKHLTDCNFFLYISYFMLTSALCYSINHNSARPVIVHHNRHLATYRSS